MTLRIDVDVDDDNENEVDVDVDVDVDQPGHVDVEATLEGVGQLGLEGKHLRRAAV